MASESVFGTRVEYSNGRTHRAGKILQFIVVHGYQGTPDVYAMISDEETGYVSQVGYRGIRVLQDGEVVIP